MNSFTLCDIAGVDGLQVMKALVGQEVDRIAPFQSLEAEIEGISCSVLRLCEGNFRLSWQGKNRRLLSYLESTAAGQRVWVQQFPWLSAILLPERISLDHLIELAVAKPPFRLSALALHCAAPARIVGRSILVWRHPIQGREQIELHLAAQQQQAIESLLTPPLLQT